MKKSQEQKILEILARLEARMATKDDLKGFATKDDLKGFATKDDLAALENRLMTHIDMLAGNYAHIEEMFIILGQRTCDNEVQIHRIKKKLAMT